MWDDEGEKIEDNESIQEIKHGIWGLYLFKTVYPLIRPVLSMLGVDVEELDRSLERVNVKEMWEDYNEWAKLSDEFNAIFGDRAWIMYGNMNVDMAEEALTKAENEGMDAAEDLLVSYYDSKEVKRQIDRLRAGVKAFEPRSDLAYKAWRDYEEERYHACIPLVLALTDGMVTQTSVNELGYQRGFFHKTADFTAWDSIAAHEKGLERLADEDLFLKSRGSTTTDHIEIPYRHGIVHGMDLGFDNKIVAAKSWALLFAAGEWARKAEAGELEGPPETEDESFFETINEAVEKHKKNEKRKEKMRDWTPREIEVGKDIPEDGDNAEYEKGTPERGLIEMLYYWREWKPGYLAPKFIDRNGNGAEVSDIVDEFEEVSLESYRLKEVTDFAVARSEITVELLIDRGDGPEWEEKTVQMTYVKDIGKPGIPELDNGNWTVQERGVFLDEYRT